MLAQSAEGVAAWLQANPLPFPLLTDPDRAVIKQYGIWHALGWDALNIARPAAFLVDRSRTIQYRFVSKNQWDRPAPEGLMVAAANVK